jgi:hypothetical protein
MSWARLDDSFIDHPKMVGLRLELVGLWAKALAYCGRHLTDGAIQRALLPQLAGVSEPRAVKLAEELVKAGLWEHAGTDYLVHDYLDWNPSRREVLAERERRSRAGQAAARARWGLSESPFADACESHAKSQATRNADRIAIASEVPCTRPVPAHPTRAEAPSAPSWSAYLETLGADDREVLSRIPEAVASTRKSGRVAASVLDGLAREFARYPAGTVVAGAQIYLDRGDAAELKGERYLLGIIRRETERASLSGNGHRPPAASRASRRAPPPLPPSEPVYRRLPEDLP